MATLNIGTCSWKYSSWRGIVYPEFGDVNFLEEYSKKYNTVEVDRWFWSLFEGGKAALPKLQDVESYAQSVPDDFKFTVKMPNSLTLTHHYQQSKSEPQEENMFFLDNDLTEKFYSAITGMKEKTGVLMYQFEYLNKTKMKSVNEFTELLRKYFSITGNEYFNAIETRNPNYLCENYFRSLTENGLGHVFLQGYYMPPVWGVYGKFRENIKHPVVIRLHGPDRKGMEKLTGNVWNKIVAEKDDELYSIAEMITDILSRDIDVYVNVNNHYEGSAPLTIEKLEKLL